MFTNVEKFIDILCKHDLTADEFLFCYLIHMDKKGFPLIYKYVENVTTLNHNLNTVKGGWSEGSIKKLLDKNFIFSMNKYNASKNRDDHYPDFYLPTTTFKEIIAFELEEAFEEVLALYPPFINIDGKNIPAKSCDIEALSTIYCRMIKDNIKTHEEVLDLLKYAVDNSMISMGIEKWVKSRQWETIRQAKVNNIEKFDFTSDI